MRILLSELSSARQKAAVAPVDLSPTTNSWSPFLHEPWSGSWQRGITVDRDTVLKFPALFSCITLIASDIAKLGIRLQEIGTDRVWRETTSPSFSPVLRKPNKYQNRIQFREHWMLSKLTYGNTYVLKQRDNRGIVTALYVLDPNLVTPLTAPGAEVFYRLNSDKLSTISEAVTVPGSEIIHDRMNAGMWHPLVGVSPITACGLASQQGLEILTTSTKFFENGARPGGILTAPGAIGKETAERLKSQWQTNFAGENVGKVAVLGDGLEYKSLSVNPTDAQLIEQLGMSEKMVCTAYHVPGYKIGVGDAPKYDNAQVLNQIYYSDCLQKLIEDFELLMEEGLSLPANYGVELSLDDLLKMDAETQMKVATEGVKGRIFTPDEGRKRFNLPAQPGGNSLYGQDQDHALDWIQWRDGQPGSTTNPPRLPGKATSDSSPPANDDQPEDQPADQDDEQQAAAFGDLMRKALLSQ